MLIRLLLLCLGLFLLTALHAEELNVMQVEGGKACDFIRYNYPQTKYCMTIHNKTNISLNIKQENSEYSTDLAPTYTLVLFSPLLKPNGVVLDLTNIITNAITEITGENNDSISCFNKMVMDKAILDCSKPNKE